MEIFDIEKPKININLSYTVTKSDVAIMKRKIERAKELDIKLFVLDGEIENRNEIKELEDFIVDNYIDNDIDVPEELKQKLFELRELLKATE